MLIPVLFVAAMVASGALGVWYVRRRFADLPDGGGLPLGLADSPAEAFAAGESEAGCDPTPKPGVVAFRDWVLSRWGGYDAGIPRACEQGGDSGHKVGRSWDWGTPAGQVKANRAADVDAFVTLLLANDAEVLRRAGITYLIWNRRIWSTRTRGWQPYNGADPHTTHVHFSFGTPGAEGRTSLYQALRSSSSSSNA